MADAGYSGRKFLSLVRWQYSAYPVVNLNPTHTKLLADYGVQNTLEGKTLFKQRQAVERSFSRLKGQRSLNHITVRRLRKVTAHCYLSLIAMQASKTVARDIPERIETVPVLPNGIGRVGQLA